MKKMVSILLVLSMIWSTASASAVVANNIEEETLASTPMLPLADAENVQGSENEYDRFIVKTRSGVNVERFLNDDMGIPIDSVDEKYTSATGYTVISLREKVSHKDFIAQMGDLVEFVQPDYKLQIASLPGADTQGALERVGETSVVPEAIIDKETNLHVAHECSTGNNVTVALIDTGIDLTHPDLTGHFIAGWDFLNDTSSVSATGTSWGEIHGTHIAGTIVEVAPSSLIMPLCVFKEGYAYTSDVIAAIRYAESNGAQIVNCSWVCEEDNPALRAIIESSDMLFVAAAGNNGSNINDCPVYPAAYPFDNVISVASIGENGGISNFSNYGDAIDIAAWGQNVISAIPGGDYGDMTGTSVSVAFVSGAAALTVSAGTTIQDAKQTLKLSANKVSTLCSKIDNGNVLNFFAATNGIETLAETDLSVVADTSASASGDAWDEFAACTIKQVACGGTHIAVLMTDGSVWTWGQNSFGELGIGSSDDKNYLYPQKVAGLSNIVAIAAGLHNTLAVNSSGDVYGWGYNAYGQMGNGTTLSRITFPQKSDITGVSSAKISSYNGVFLKSTGSVWVTGYNLRGVFGDGTQGSSTVSTPQLISSLSSIKAIDLSTFCVAAVTQGGSAYVWGTMGSTAYSKPTALLSGTAIKDIKTGNNMLVALSEDGNKVWHWDHFPASSYEITQGETSYGAGQVTGISAGTQHYLLLMADGTIKAGGSNSQGQFGNGGTYSANGSTAQVLSGPSTSSPAFSNVKAISSAHGSNTNLAWTEDGGLWVWGGSFYTLMGSDGSPTAKYPQQIGDTITELIAPEPVSTPYGVGVDNLYSLPKTVSAKLLSGRTVDVNVTWSSPSYDPELIGTPQILAGEITTPVRVVNSAELLSELTVTVRGPQTIVGVDSVAPIDVPYGATWDDLMSQLPAAVMIHLEDGSAELAAITWNESTYIPTLFGEPQPVSGTLSSTSAYTNCDSFAVEVLVTVASAPITAFDAGYMHSLCIRSDGTVWAWGDNTYGQLGNGNNQSSVSPQKVLGLSNVKQISAGYYHNLAYCDDGTLWQWGRDIGNTPQKVDLTNVSKISAGLDYTLVISANTVYGWGKNDKGQLGLGYTYERIVVPQVIYRNSKGIITVSAGAEHSLLLTRDEAVYGWGYNSCGELGEADVGKTILQPRLLSFSEDIGHLGSVSAGNKTSFVGGYGGILSFGQSMIRDSGVDHTPDKIGSKAVFSPDYLDLGATIAVHTMGYGYTYGDNTYGQRADGSFSPMLGSSTLQSEEEGLAFAAPCAAGGEHIIIHARNADTVWACGRNSKGQLGDGTTYDSCYPIEVGKPRYVKSVDLLEQTKNVAFGTQVADLELPTSLHVLINGGKYIDVPVEWDTSEYDGSQGRTEQIIRGSLVLPENVLNSSNFMPVVTVNVGKDPNEKDIVSYEQPKAVTVKYEATKNELQQKLPTEVKVFLEDGSAPMCEVIWDVSGYNNTQTNTSQTFWGEFVVEPGMANPENIVPKIEVTVSGIIIEGIEPQTLDTWQSLLLGPTNREHIFGGSPSTESLPETAVVILSTGEKVERPVIWDMREYDPDTPGQKEFYGDVVLDEGSNIANPNGIRAKLNVTIHAKEYYVIETAETSISVLLGTDIAELNNALIREGKNELDVWAVDENFDDAYLVCNVVLAEDQGSAYDMNTPGSYDLIACLPENCLNYETNVNEILFSVTVLEPSEIVKAEASMNYYQSAAPKDMSNIPTQATVTLENGRTILSDVQWDWSTFDKNHVGEQIVLGDLVNLPAAAKQPDGQALKATMVVNVLPVQYEVAEIRDNVLTGSAGLDLDELNVILTPTVTLALVSTTEGIDFSTEYPISVTLQDTDSVFDPEYAQEYTFEGVFELPDNIVWPETVANEIHLTTTPVEITDVEQLYAVAGEGVEFEDVELPAQVTVTLSCVGIDGTNKKAVLDIDWGAGEGYTPIPDHWNDDGTATLTVTGAITNCPQYIANADEISPVVQITMTPAPNLVLITPNQVPVAGTLEVKLGSTLDDIYAALDSHSVQLTLEDYQGNQHTVDMTFTLRAEDNLDYDPLTQGIQKLNAYLPLGNVIKNQDDLKVEVTVRTMQYTIFTVRTTPCTRTIGTPFSDLELPEKVTITRNDKQTEELGVTWSDKNYNSTKIGNQVIQGTLETPLPVHLTNPNNRQPKVLLTLVDPDTQILSLTPVANKLEPVMLYSLRDADDNSIPGFTEFQFWAELRHGDGSVSIEIISIFVESDDYAEDF